MNKTRTAAYCRVSTEMEIQEGSFDIQTRYYTDLINNNPDMELVGIYGDKGKSGLTAEKRPGLQSLLEDCRSGKIDLILCKSVSRFARNMADFVEMVRELRRIGVNAYFEKEHLDTKTPGCDMILDILAIVAEEESNSISQNLIMSYEQRVKEGRIGGSLPYGYCNGENSEWVIKGEEASRVRTAFYMASIGKPYKEIISALDEMEGKPTWKQDRLKTLLGNVAYKGDYYSHKNVTIIPGKSVPNKGLKDRYYLVAHHDAIVPPDLFDKVQEIMKRKLLYSYRKLRPEDIQFINGGEENGKH